MAGKVAMVGVTHPMHAIWSKKAPSATPRQTQLRPHRAREIVELVVGEPEAIDVKFNTHAPFSSGRLNVRGVPGHKRGRENHPVALDQRNKARGNTLTGLIPSSAGADSGPFHGRKDGSRRSSFLILREGM